MTRDAFGRPTEDLRFPSDEFQALLPRVYDMTRDDKEAIVEWCRKWITNRVAMFQLLLTLAECIKAMLEDHQRRQGHDPAGSFAALSVAPDASRAQVLFGRLLSATLNGDRDMQTGLIKTLIEHTERSDEPDDIAVVQVELFGLLHFLMHEHTKELKS